MSLVERIRRMTGNVAPFAVYPERRPYGAGVRLSCLVLDCSGSMACTDWLPSRHGGAKEATEKFCERLAVEEPEALVSIIGFGDLALTYCAPTPASELPVLRSAINKIDTFGETNMRAGLQAALNVISGHHGETQLVILSDGHNTGRNPRSLADTIKHRAVLECVGIGGNPADVDEDLLKDIASEYPDGTKRYRWIGDKEGLVREFHRMAGRIRRL